MGNPYQRTSSNHRAPSQNDPYIVPPYAPAKEVLRWRGGMANRPLIRGVKMSPRFCFLMFIGLIVSASLSGCGRRVPTIVPVKGTILLAGQPLPKAMVQFIPQRSDLGAEFTSTAVTDENGGFTLTCGYKDLPGAIVGQHTIVITESPLPEALRNTSDYREIERYQAKLPNRPIPSQYGSATRSPLKIEIKEGQPEVKL